MRSITLENVTKTYPSGVTAVDGVSLDVPPGEWLVLVGPSGCGKTTLLRLIAGLETPTRGVVRLGDRVVNDVPPRERDVALLFQRPALVPSQTVRDNLAWPWTLRRVFGGRLTAKQDEELRHVGGLLGIGGLLDRRAEELSGGQQQRVALGRALVRRADVTLLDEPLGHLEAPLRLQLRHELRLLYQQFPATILYVTHDPAEALALGERVAVLLDGKLRQVGAPDKVERAPATRFVAEFFGAESPLNFFDGRLTDDAGRTFLVGPWGRWEVPDAVRPRLGGGPDVTAGVRARDVKVTSAELFDARTDIIVETTVLLTERAAAGHWVIGRHVGGRITALAADGRGPARGQKVMLTFSLRNALWFDRTTGDTLPVRTG
jgi:multiple sugar transport system ATP-binding protein